MAITHDEYLASLPAAERAAIRAESARLVAGEYNLRRLREARKLSQVEIATSLGLKQAAVSRLERRTDMMLGTLRKYVEAAGGRLRLVAEFPDGTVVKISHVRGLKGVAKAKTPTTEPPADA